MNANICKDCTMLYINSNGKKDISNLDLNPHETLSRA